jgi:hypothetical protein
VTTDADGLLAARFAATRGVPSPGDWEDVLRRAWPTTSESSLVSVVRRPRRLYVAFAAVVTAALFGSAFAFAPMRSALISFLEGAAPPGGQIEPGTLPAWLSGNTALPSRPSGQGGPRLLAQQDGARLLAYRDASGRACLVFGNDSDTCSSADAWRRLFSGHALLKLASGVGPTANGKVAVFGIARSSVESVELRDGNQTVATAPVTQGGWVIVASQEPHDSLVGVDQNGKAIESLDARSWTWKPCTHESGCPPPPD